MSLIDNNISVSKEDIKIYSAMDGLSMQNLFYLKHSQYPSCCLFADSNGYGENDGCARINVEGLYKYVCKTFNENQYELCKYETYNLTKNKIFLSLYIYFKELDVFCRIESSPSETYILYANGNEKNMKYMRNIIKRYYKKPIIEKSNLYLIAQSQMGFKLNKHKVKHIESFDLNKLYNDDFKPIDEKIKNFINTDGSGLVILHGVKGSGKTSYIRKTIDENSTRRFIFVPANMIELIGQPSFNDFLFTLKDSVIILEDCENVIKSRSSLIGNSSAVSLLLNMCDGLLSDMFNIKFICTFNEQIDRIDDALLRKGRLVCKYEFKELSKEKTAALLKEQKGIDDYDGEGMTLADIFNFDEESYENEKGKRFGFNN